MGKYLKFILPVLILLIIIAGYFLLSSRSVLVRKADYSKRIIKRTVSATGTVKSENEADLAFAAIGRVEDLAYKKGEFVKENDMLSYLSIFADYKSIQAARDTADISKRDKDLFIEQYENDKDAAGGEDEYDIQLRRYDEYISKAEANYEALTSNLSKSYIYAPFDGQIIDISKDEGETVLAGEHVIKLADTENILFKISLDQEDYGYLKEDMSVEISLDAYEGRKFPGKIKTLPTYINGTGTNFEVDIVFTGETKDILLGMTGDAHIILAETNTEVSSLIFDDIYYDFEDKPYVFVENNGKAEKKYIELGLQGDLYVEVKTEIDKTVILPKDEKSQLEEGKSVKII